MDNNQIPTTPNLNSNSNPVTNPNFGVNPVQSQGMSMNNSAMNQGMNVNPNPMFGGGMNGMQNQNQVFGVNSPIVGTNNGGQSLGWLKWGALALGVVAIVVVACIFLPKLFGGPNYGETYRLSNELYEKLEDIMGSRTSACYNMTRYATDSDVEVSKYKEYTAGCKEDMVKARDLTDKIGKSSGVSKDTDLKEKYETLEKTMNEALPTKQNVDKMEKVFIAVHEFAIRIEKIDSDSTEADVREAAKALADSGSEDWVEFGKGWESRMLAYIKAYQAYSNASASDANYSTLRREYNDALSDVRDYLSDLDINNIDNGGLKIGALDDLNDAAYKFKEAARKLYEKNYDGKDEENCVDYGDGEASCR